MSDELVNVTQGESIRTLTVGSMVLTQTFHDSETSLAPHAHKNAAITFVVSGSFSESYGMNTIDCKENSVLFKPGGLRHSNKYHGLGALSFLIELQPEMKADLSSFGDFDNYVTKKAGGILSALAGRAYYHFQVGNPVSGLELEDLLLELLSKSDSTLKRNSTQRVPDWLSSVRDRINDDAASSHRLSSLARDEAVHPVHLARCFRAYFGCSVGEYVHRCRLDRAVNLLSQTQTPIVDISLGLGYSDQSHFNRMFKREVGLTPLRYRKMCRAMSR